jgi:hypothetical protein
MTQKRKNRTRRGGQSVISNITSTASSYGQKVKDWISNLGKSTPSSTYSSITAPITSYSSVGGKRGRRLKTRKHKRGGSVSAYNKYVDPFTMNTTPVSGYSSARPHNWVGGKSRKRRH